MFKESLLPFTMESLTKKANVQLLKNDGNPRSFEYALYQLCASQRSSIKGVFYASKTPGDVEKYIKWAFSVIKTIVVSSPVLTCTLLICDKSYVAARKILNIALRKVGNNYDFAILLEQYAKSSFQNTSNNKKEPFTLESKDTFIGKPLSFSSFSIYYFFKYFFFLEWSKCTLIVDEYSKLLKNTVLLDWLNFICESNSGILTYEEYSKNAPKVPLKEIQPNVTSDTQRSDRVNSPKSTSQQKISPRKKEWVSIVKKVPQSTQELNPPVDSKKVDPKNSDSSNIPPVECLLPSLVPRIQPKKVSKLWFDENESGSE